MFEEKPPKKMSPAARELIKTYKNLIFESNIIRAENRGLETQIDEMREESMKDLGPNACEQIEMFEKLLSEREIARTENDILKSRVESMRRKIIELELEILPRPKLPKNFKGLV